MKILLTVLYHTILYRGLLVRYIRLASSSRASCRSFSTSFSTSSASSVSRASRASRASALHADRLGEDVRHVLLRVAGRHLARVRVGARVRVRLRLRRRLRLRLRLRLRPRLRLMLRLRLRAASSRPAPRTSRPARRWRCTARSVSRRAARTLSSSMARAPARCGGDVGYMWGRRGVDVDDDVDVDVVCGVGWMCGLGGEMWGDEKE